MFGGKEERLERKIKELNAIKAEYRQQLDDAERQLRNGVMDKEQFKKIKERMEEHIERLNEKIRETREKLNMIKR